MSNDIVAVNELPTSVAETKFASPISDSTLPASLAFLPDFESSGNVLSKRRLDFDRPVSYDDRRIAFAFSA